MCCSSIAAAPAACQSKPMKHLDYARASVVLGTLLALGLQRTVRSRVLDSALFLPEIYGLDIDNKLMVLSACETGIGKLHTGESAISLANGFVQAGVNNIIFSLWQVNDYTTSGLMANFYQHYANNEAAHLALRNAKLDYLKDERISLTNKSPYFWASFVYYGTTQIESTDIDSKAFPYAVLLIGIGFILLVYLLFRALNKR